MDRRASDCGADVIGNGIDVTFGTITLPRCGRLARVAKRGGISGLAWRGSTDWDFGSSM